jgi:hypothetical protein
VLDIAELEGMDLQFEVSIFQIKLRELAEAV